MKNKNWCAKCMVRIDKKKTLRYRVKIKKQWIVDFFVAIKVDCGHFTWLCNKCYTYLKKLQKENSIISAINEINSKHTKSKSFNEQNYDCNFYEKLSEIRFKAITGISKANFDDLFSHIESYNYQSYISKKDALLFYLARLRLGISSKKLNSIFNIASYSRCVESIPQIRKMLVNSFVDKNLGFHHVTRELINERYTTTISRKLFTNNDNQMITVWDGTYVYIQKSSNYTFSKKTFSMHKHRPLLKMMMSVTTKGYIIDSLGPYLADNSNNDAAITKHILEDNERVKAFFQEEDVFIVDRGFRDSIAFFYELGLNV